MLASNVLRELVAGGALDLAQPGSGSMLARLEALAELGADDLSVARLAEGHADAVAILAEAGRAPRGGATYGVWAADPPDSRLTVRPRPGGWSLAGRKRYCSGAADLDVALVTAYRPEEDRPRLFEIDLDVDGLRAVPGSWPAIGMADSNSLDVDFDDVGVADGAVVGGPGWYLDRPGFWHGGVGVTACWYGGALGCERLLRQRLVDRARGRPPSEHALAHLGAVVATNRGMWTALVEAAVGIDDDPLDIKAEGRMRALVVRHLVERGATEVLDRTGRALGSNAMVFDGRHARRTADLPVYLRQSHAEADLAQLGRLALEPR